MSQLASYFLSAYSFITTHSPEKLLEVGYMSKDGDPIPSFDENFLIDLCTEARQIFEQEDNVLDIEGDFIVVGDIHGSIHDLLRILQYIHQSDVKVVFLGDYVDRGNFSIECVSILFAMKILSPDRYYLIRGNHEFDNVCSLYGFKEEILNYHDPKKTTCDSSRKSDDDYNGYDMNCYKYTENLYNAFLDAFSYLPICAVINNTTFCIHGGLSPKLNHVNDINSLIQKPIASFEENPLITDLVWSDPSHSSKQYEENLRGRGFLFNRESVLNFLKSCNLTRMVRGHQCVKNGIQKSFNNKCITVFSASSYDKNLGNSSAILKIVQSNDSVTSQVFAPLPRLQKSDSSYCKVQPLNPSMKRIKTCFSFLHPQLHTVSSLRMSASGSIQQVKLPKPDDFPGFQRSTSRVASIVKPRFTTKAKKGTLSFEHRPRSLSMSSASMMLNEFTNDCNNNNNNVVFGKCDLASNPEK